MNILMSSCEVKVLSNLRPLRPFMEYNSTTQTSRVSFRQAYTIVSTHLALEPASQKCAF